jgi:hypothetical protein
METVLGKPAPIADLTGDSLLILLEITLASEEELQFLKGHIDIDRIAFMYFSSFFIVNLSVVILLEDLQLLLLETLVRFLSRWDREESLMERH